MAIRFSLQKRLNNESFKRKGSGILSKRKTNGLFHFNNTAGIRGYPQCHRNLLPIFHLKKNKESLPH